MRFMISGAILLVCLGSAPSLAEDKGVILWRDARIGMSPAEILEAFSEAVRADGKKKSTSGSVVLARIAQHEYAGEQFEVLFYFKDEKLEHVELVLRDPGSRDEYLAVYDNLIRKLRKHYGEPMISSDQRPIDILILKHTDWQYQNVAVSLIYIASHDGPVNVKIYFYPTPE